jgi:hypothetical protein
MMFLPMHWQLASSHQVFDINPQLVSAIGLIAQTAQITARGFDLQRSHSRVLDPTSDAHFDLMPAGGAGTFAATKDCVRLERKALITEQWGSRNRGASYQGFAGVYIFTDRKLAATNIEADLGYAKDAYSGNVEKIAPNCP